jgi:hypothetical protein
MSWRTSSWAALRPAIAWQCPSGILPPQGSSTARPVWTIVSLREPRCPFCGRAYRDEYRISVDGGSR